MTSTTRVRRMVLCGVAAAGLFTAMCGPASAAADVSQATAQAVNLDLAAALHVAVSNPPTSAHNDGNDSNAQINGSPLVSALGGESFLTAGALKESTEANQDGSSYGCAGVVSPGGGIQIGQAGKTCSATGNTGGGVTLDLGALPGLGGLAALAGGDIKITVDAITAHGYVKGTGPATLGASVANITAQIGNGAPITVNIGSGPNKDLLGAVLTALAPSLGLLGTAVSNLLKGVVSLTTNYQPAPEPNASGVYSVSGLHVTLLGGGLATADLAKVTVGANTNVLPVDSFSFQDLPLILGLLALVIAVGFGAKRAVRRLRVQA